MSPRDRTRSPASAKGLLLHDHGAGAATPPTRGVPRIQLSSQYSCREICGARRLTTRAATTADYRRVCECRHRADSRVDTSRLSLYTFDTRESRRHISTDRRRALHLSSLEIYHEWSTLLFALTKNRRLSTRLRAQLRPPLSRAAPDRALSS